MKASEYMARQLSPDVEESYGARFVGQPRVLTTMRLPVELVAWLDVLRAKGLGDSRNEVMQVLLDAAIEQVHELGVCGDGSHLSDMVDAVKEQLMQKLEEAHA